MHLTKSRSASLDPVIAMSMFLYKFQARLQREADEAQQENERAAQLAAELNEQIQADARRQLLAKRNQYKARHRANSEATEVPGSGDMLTESFVQEIELNDIRFNTVKIFSPRQGSTFPHIRRSHYLTLPQIECLGTTYLATPVCDDAHVMLSLELFVFTFNSHYYITSQGELTLAMRVLIISSNAF